MSRKKTPIPVKSFEDELKYGMLVERLALKDLPEMELPHPSERHQCHSFFLIENRTATLEIDLQKRELNHFTLIYIHPDQVHRMINFSDLTVTMLLIDEEKLKPEYRKLLRKLTPVLPRQVNEQSFSLLADAAFMSLKVFNAELDSMHNFILKDSCNAFVGLAIQAFQKGQKPAEKILRYGSVTNLFIEILDDKFLSLKTPGDYAKELNLSTSYLNECVRNTTGHSVTHHIQQRVVLEASRLLHHTTRSVNQIATELGFEDHRYFSRLFSKVTGASPLTFRKKNSD